MFHYAHNITEYRYIMIHANLPDTRVSISQRLREEVVFEKDSVSSQFKAIMLSNVSPPLTSWLQDRDVTIRHLQKGPTWADMVTWTACNWRLLPGPCSWELNKRSKGTHEELHDNHIGTYQNIPSYSPNQKTDGKDWLWMTLAKLDNKYQGKHPQPSSISSLLASSPCLMSRAARTNIMSPRKMRAALGRQEWFTKEASKKIPDKVLSFKGGIVTGVVHLWFWWGLGSLPVCKRRKKSV